MFLLHKECIVQIFLMNKFHMDNPSIYLSLQKRKILQDKEYIDLDEWKVFFLPDI
jgi:hypothetical protein